MVGLSNQVIVQSLIILCIHLDFLNSLLILFIFPFYFSGTAWRMSAESVNEMDCHSKTIKHLLMVCYFGLLLNKLIQDERGGDKLFTQNAACSPSLCEMNVDRKIINYTNITFIPISMVCTIQSSYTFNNMRASKAVTVSVKSFRATDAMTVFQEHACSKRNDNPLRTCVRQTQGQSFKNMRAANAMTVFQEHACSKRNDSFSRTCVQQTQ